MPDGTLTKAARKKEKYRRRQNEVFDAAAAVFAEKGYHGASTSDIAAKLGIAQSSLYYYFKSKDEALEMICLENLILSFAMMFLTQRSYFPPLPKTCTRPQLHKLKNHLNN